MYIPEINIDYSKCIDCGICAEECPNHKTKNGHSHVDYNNEFCDKCLHCYAVCPEHAITVKEVKDIIEKKEIEPATMLSHFMHRRSYRRFRKLPVNEVQIDQLIRAATYIPSGGNNHLFDITVIRNNIKRRELHKAIISYYSNIKKLLKNPLLRVIARKFGDPKVKATLNDPFYFSKILKHIEDIENTDDPVFYHAPVVFIFHTDRIMPTAKEDCILAAYNLVLMSETLGLGSCFVSLAQQAITNDKNCKRILSIPYSHRAESVVIIGTPERIYKRPSWRKTQEAVFV